MLFSKRTNVLFPFISITVCMLCVRLSECYHSISRQKARFRAIWCFQICLNWDVTYKHHRYALCRCATHSIGCIIECNNVISNKLLFEMMRFTNDPDANLALLVKLYNDVEFNYPRFKQREWHRRLYDSCFVCLTPFRYVMLPSNSLPGYRRHTDSIRAGLSSGRKIKLCQASSCLLSFLQHFEIFKVLPLSVSCLYIYENFECSNGELIYFLVHITRRTWSERYSTWKKSEFFLSILPIIHPWQYVRSCECAFMCLC